MNKNPGSFRDPSGFIFCHDGIIYRQVNKVYKDDYDLLFSSGLYQSLVNEGLLLPHEEVNPTWTNSGEKYKILKPELLQFISYPYEWCFSQLKDAALTTLSIQKAALEFGIILKDASAFNIQFRKGNPISIDTLSFEKYKAGEPWVAYRQFCQHFFVPLALMSSGHIWANQLFKIFIDGIPLDLASSLLPISSRFKLAVLFHIHLHAKSQRYFADKTVETKKTKISRQAMLGLIDNLESAIKNMKWKAKGTEWADYYGSTNYSPEAFLQKKLIVSKYLGKAAPKTVWDFGANAGEFSRIASEKNIHTVSFDMDPAAVEINYLKCAGNGETNILPLLVDLTNSSPAIGWENRERMSLLERGPADMVLALALIHHLAISNNIPFGKVAQFFSRLCKWLVIEFVPKSDSQVLKMLSIRKDIFQEYNQQCFESEFREYFTIIDTTMIMNSDRSLYLMVKKES